jgi:2',3'-cyclic-nucleotide 2'-phosphodiesterase/3'-nucleotidase
MHGFTRRRFLRFLTAAMSFSMLASRSSAVPPGVACHLRILATTDLHGHIAAYDYYRDRPSDRVGLARLAGLIQAARAEAPNTLLLDNGDLLQGSPFADYIARETKLKPGEPHPIFRAMNRLGYDAATLGNHDFNFGLDYLVEALAGASFPYTSANVLAAETGRPLFKPWLILDRQLQDETGAQQPLRIGIFGVAPPQIMVWDRQRLSGKMTVADILETARTTIAALRSAGADLVICLAHTGLGKAAIKAGEENAGYALSTLPGIDALITGHAHRVFPNASFGNLPNLDLAKGTLNGVPTVMAGCFGGDLGIIDLALERQAGGWKVSDGQASTRALRDASVENDPAIERAIAAEHRATLAYVRRPVGTLTMPLNTYFALAAPCPAVALVAAVQSWAIRQAMQDEPDVFAAVAHLPLLSAAAPYKSGRNGVEYYTDLAAGPVAMRNVIDLYVFPNTLALVKVTGAELCEWLEMGCGLFRQIKPETRAQNLLEARAVGHDFETIYGVTYRIDLGQAARYRKGGALSDPPSRRIVDLCYEGKPVIDRDEFLVVTSNYRADGGGSFPGLDGTKTVFDGADPLQDIIVNYFRAMGDVTPPAEQPWQFIIPPGATVVFETATEGAAHVPADGSIVYYGPADEGFTKFQVKGG